MKRTLKVLAALSLALAASGCVVTARGRVHGGAVVAYEEPPAPQPEVVEARAGFVFIRGHYEWRGGQYVWVAGHWERERSGYYWIDGRWEQRGGSWHWIEGRWEVGSSGQVTGGGYVEPDRSRVRDHRYDNPPPGHGGVPPGHGGTPPGHAHAQNPDGSGVGAVVGGGNVTVTVHGPRQAPPPVRVENPGPARRGFVWISGHYEWRGNQYEWVPGHWERAKASQIWFDGRWELRGSVYVWVPGYWGVQGSVQSGPQQPGPADRRTH